MVKVSFQEIFGINNRFAILNLITRNLKLRYRKSVLGIFWTMLIPAFNAGVYFFAFKLVFKTDVPFYLMFLVSGLVCWAFFSQAVGVGVESIVAHYGILSKVPIAPSVFPLSEVAGALINLVLSMPVLVAIALTVGNGVGIQWLLLVPWLMLLFFQTYFISLGLSVLFVFLRDLRHFVSILMQAWFYLTPVVYRGEMLPGQFSFIKYLNPLWMIFDNIHGLFLNELAMNSTQDFLLAFAWTVVLGLFALLVYSYNRKVIVEKL